MSALTTGIAQNFRFFILHPTKLAWDLHQIRVNLGGAKFAVNNDKFKVIQNLMYINSSSMRQF